MKIRYTQGLKNDVVIL